MKTPTSHDSVHQILPENIKTYYNLCTPWVSIQSDANATG